MDSVSVRLAKIHWNFIRQTHPKNLTIEEAQAAQLLLRNIDHTPIITITILSYHHTICAPK